MSAWKDYVTAALLGSGKSALPALPSSLQAALGDTETMDAESRFLTHAGAIALWRRAGWKPLHHETAVVAAESESTAPLSRASMGHLRAMLAGRCLSALPEWLGEVARSRRHVPPELLPALLDRARQERVLRSLVISAGGQRALWLAAQNPLWSFGESALPESWETGGRDQRLAILRCWRAETPAMARAKVEEVWAAEPADIRTALVAELATNLSEEDTPFLERLLDDRSKEARRAVIDLLARLPASPFVARMTARVTPLLHFTKGGLLSRATLEVTLPGDPDAAATRDGLDPKAFGQQKILGEKAVLLVLMLSAVPLRHWTEAFQQTPEALLKAVQKSEFARALATGWAWAALRQRDATWAEALLDGGVAPHGEFLPAKPLLIVLPDAARAVRLAALLREGALTKKDTTRWQEFTDLLSTLPGHLPPALARDLLAVLRKECADGLPWHLRSLAESFLLRLPPAMLGEAAQGWPIDQEGVAPLVEILSFRHDALTALTPS
ncbi:conserved hypothetical protein [Chthoniobacter flavus Ellin428]|uniref:Uncharacterized protein n=1 Tax=Chthoniobacter flavus Ellin428 TaxID=497964 RepID=B4CZ80_9BACT|nr:DUF5691 domain-containing protein [Chthoniobacter flavus]EDY20771.1 conserved hypothetical protein [Chthoniobacter flavus Ellin428]TCO89665.1 hypothetical protein EV701_113101 [Chthoniobacter flavus]